MLHTYNSYISLKNNSIQISQSHQHYHKKITRIHAMPILLHQLSNVATMNKLEIQYQRITYFVEAINNLSINQNWNRVKV